MVKAAIRQSLPPVMFRSRTDFLINRPARTNPQSAMLCTSSLWIYRNRTAPETSAVSDSDLGLLAEELGISELLASILRGRGLDSRTSMDTFLSPGLRHLKPLDTWPGLAHAAELLADAVQRQEPVAIWGDYDVDGITATALLKDFFRRRGLTVDHHLPDRLKEGYGLNLAGVEALADRGVKVLITVDCGISDIEPVRRACELGMTVFITDHHVPGPELPPARAVLNPKLGTWPCCDLAGVGVAFFLAAALNRVLPGPALDIRRFLDLVALGTVADVVRLSEQNRILVKNGLLLLKEGARPGIRALKTSCNMEAGAPLGAGSIGFGLAPRINAACRLGSPEVALELLLVDTEEAAAPLAATLDRMNTERRKIEQETLEEALVQAERMPDSPGLVLYSPEWHPGVIGIVASRMVEAFHRPCLLLARDTNRGVIKGSGRSVSGFDLHAGLAACSDHLVRFGGHPMAAGVTMEVARIPDLRDTFARGVRADLGDNPTKQPVKVDALLGFYAIDLSLIQELDLLEPVEPGNPRPVFICPQVRVLRQKLLSRGKHLDLTLQDTASGVTLRGVLWREGEAWQGTCLEGRLLRIAFTPKQSAYQGLTRIELTIKAILEVDQQHRKVG